MPNYSSVSAMISDLRGPDPVPPTLLVDVEAEQALLGSIMLRPALYAAISKSESLLPGDFSHPVHARTYSAIGALIADGAVPDLLLIKDALGEDPVLVPHGGTARYLGMLIETAGAASNAAHYARKLVDLAQRRAAVQSGEELIANASDPLRPLSEIVDGIVSNLRSRVENGAKHDDGLRVIHFDDMQPQLGGGYLVKGLLGSTGMAVIYGAPGSRKTFFALRLGLSVAAGMPFFGRRTKRCGVVYIAAEAGRTIENRVVAARGEFPPGTPFIAITSPIDLCSSDADVTRLVTRIRGMDLGVPIGLIIIDTLSRVLAGGNENAPEDMGALVQNCDRLREETGACLALVHHSGKDAAKGARGHSLLYAATDTEIEITADETSNQSTASVTKQRDLPTEGSFTFALRSVELGADEDGDPVTSCTVDENVTPAEPPPKRERPLTGAAAAGMQQLLNCMASLGKQAIETAHIPGGVTCVTLEDWKSWLIRAGILNPDGNPREEFRRIRVTLQGRKNIGVWGGYVWASHPSHARHIASHVTGCHTVTSVTSPYGEDVTV
jgi:hypothetical protein